MGKWLGKVLLISGWLVSGMVLAEEPFFRIAGAGCCNGKGEVVLTRAEFEALPQTEVKTGTPWTEGEHLYRGVLLRDLVRIYGLKSQEAKALAVNEYWAALPLEDGEKYPVLVAEKQDGKALTLRKQGADLGHLSPHRPSRTQQGALSQPDGVAADGAGEQIRCCAASS